MEKKCFICGGNVNWVSDEDVSENPLECDGDLISHYKCYNCGASYDVFIPATKEE